MCASASPQYLNRAWRHTDGNEWKQRCLWLLRTFKVKIKISCRHTVAVGVVQEKQCFAYYTGAEISEGLHSRLSTGGTELRLKEPED